MAQRTRARGTSRTKGRPHASGSRRRTAANRKVTRQAKPRQPSTRVIAKMAAEFEDAMCTVEDAVAACVRLRRWDDLEAAVKEYSTVLGVDASLLLFTAMLRPMPRHALALTDPGRLAEYAVHVRTGLELSTAGWPRRQSIEFLKTGIVGPALTKN